MWEEWAKRSDAIGRDVVLFDLAQRRLTGRALGRYFSKLGPVMAEPLIRGGKTVTHLYWRIGYDYRGK